MRVLRWIAGPVIIGLAFLAAVPLSRAHAEVAAPSVGARPSMAASWTTL